MAFRVSQLSKKGKYREEKKMGFIFEKRLPKPEEIREQFPLTEELKKIKEERDTEIRKVITGEENKLLVIIGPCSADNESAVCDYVSRLAKVQEKVKEKLILIPRIYTNKPRTTGEGYKGMLHQPDPEKKPDLLAGLIAIRKMHLKAMKETGLTAADEMLYPENWRYFMDILSYVAIGARSVEDQQHRLTVSGMDVPAGMKNPTSGDFSVMLNSIIAAQHSHSFIYRGWEVHTDGNPLAHAVLRGAVNKHGQCNPNYHYEDLERLYDMYQMRDYKNPAVIVDSNHSNSNKQFKEQIRIVKEVLYSRSHNADIKKLVKGFMIESYIEEGSQKVGEHVYGKSITDPCLGWEDSERLIYTIAESMK
jgi:3-deoxy-7-phosphoheptulonate synthase